MECEALLSDDPAPYEAPLAELQRQLVALLAPASLHPQNSENALLALERAHANGLAELEQAGHDTRGITVYEFIHKLSYLEKKQNKAR